jgi:NADPH2:quinone reductase
VGAKTLRVGFIGCGRIADLQCLGYLGHPHATIVAVCDANPERAARRAAEWGAARACSRVEELLADPAIDAVEILTPHHLHEAHATAALEAGKHVSLQKPPTRTLPELDRLARAARRSGRVLRVFENFMYYPPHVRAKRLVDEGAIGTPVSIRIKTAAGRLTDGWEVGPDSQAWRLDPATCGGGATTFDHGYHCFHMARFFVPAEVERVHAFIHWTRLGDTARIDGPALVSWRYAGDPPRFGSWEVILSLQMRVRSDYYVSDDRLEIHGTEGVIWVNRCTGKLLEEPSVVLYRDGETRAFHDLATDWAESFRLGGIDFVDALLENRPPPQTPEEARRTLALALAAARSAAEGREVALAELEPSGVPTIDRPAVARASAGGVDSMKAVLCREFGPPEKLVVEDVPAPEAKPGQVVIEVHASGVNFPDLLIIENRYQFKPPLPFSPGGEVAGIVREVGAGVSHVRRGQRVLASIPWGGFAEQVAAPAAGVIPIPDEMDFVVAAAFLMTYGTSHHALKDRARLAPGETLLVLGAAGGVGLAAVEIGKVMGARVIAAASSDEKLAVCKEHGADELVHYGREDVKERTRELTGGRGADVVYDPVGGPYSEPALRATNWNGRFLVVGFAAGEIPRIPLNLTLLKGCSVVGVFWGAFVARETARHLENVRELLGWWAAGRLRPHVFATYPLERVAEGLRALAERRVTGKVVLVPGAA